MNIDIFYENDNFIEYVHAANDLAEPLAEMAQVFPEEHQEVVRNQNYFEVTVPNYTDIQFVEHFRMSRQSFEILLQQVGRVQRNVNISIPLAKKLLFTIWMISKQDSFLDSGDRFKLAKSSAHSIFYEIIDILCTLSNNNIRWPDMHHSIRTANVFERRSRGIPGVVGAIDGCHIPIKQPEGNAFDYYNRKNVHSVILQGVCDERGVFIDTCIGMPGRMHDARVFRLSPIYNRLQMNQLLTQDQHLIGDTAYPLMVNLMKPFQDNGHLTREQQVYNVKLSSIRSTIERSFGLLKGKFRRLKYLDVKNAEQANKIILAACMLHNFILLQDNPQDNYILDMDGRQDNVLHEDNEIVVQAQNNDAENKRTRIVYLCNR